MLVPVDLDAVVDQLPEGSYVAKTTKVEAKKSKAGKDKLSWHLLVLEGPMKGRVTVKDTSLDPAALFDLKALAKAAGAKWTPAGVSTDDIVGKTVVINVRHEMYDGEIRAHVRSFARYQPSGS